MVVYGVHAQGYNSLDRLYLGAITDILTFIWKSSSSNEIVLNTIFFTDSVSGR